MKEPRYFYACHSTKGLHVPVTHTCWKAFRFTSHKARKIWLSAYDQTLVEPCSRVFAMQIIGHKRFDPYFSYKVVENEATGELSSVKI